MSVPEGVLYRYRCEGVGMFGVAAMLLWGCQPDPSPARHRQAGPTSSTVAPPTAVSPATTEPGPVLPSEAGWAFLAPGLRIRGEPGHDLGLGRGLSVWPRQGTHPAVFMVQSGWSYGATPVANVPSVMVLPAGSAPGTYDLDEVWDGVSGFDHGVLAQPGSHFLVPDATGDGIPDMWAGGLYPGPILGQRFTMADLVIQSPHRLYMAGFDADADGVGDIMTVDDGAIWIQYGPFPTGVLPSPSDGEVPDTDYSVIERYPNEDFGYRLPDLFGPGVDAFTLGGYGYFDLYPLQVPRGSRLSSSDGWATFGGRYTYGGSYFEVPGDLDGDGAAELITSVGQLWVPLGPILGDYIDGDASGLSVAPGSLVAYGIGDLNGDGVEELAGAYYPEGEDGWWMVSFSPHAQPLDFSGGLPIGRGWEVDAYGPGFGELHADLDEDGLDDVVVSHFHWEPGPDDPPIDPDLVWRSEIRVWYGADLLAAEQARQGR